MNKSECAKTVLPNGLTVISEFIPDAQSAAVGFFVGTGARDETAKEAGVSHFLEHMMFKGTATRSSMDMTYELGNLGAQANAFTSEENTVYYAGIIPENFSKMQALLIDMLRPALDRGEYDTEKKVILEEIALYQDKPIHYFMERASKDYFGDHPVGNSVLGSADSISALDRDEMKAYFDRRYSPKNMVLVATGQFDTTAFLADAEGLTRHWKSFESPRVYREHRSPTLLREYRKKNLTQAHVLFMSGGCSAQSEHRYAMSLLAMILGDSNGSKLYWELIDKGLADEAGADNDGRDQAGVFYAYASAEPAKVDMVAKIIERVLAHPLDFTDQDLERAKNKLIAKVVLGGELPMGRLMALGFEWTYQHKLHNLQHSLDEIVAVKRSDIERAIKEFPLTGCSQFRLLPE